MRRIGFPGFLILLLIVPALGQDLSSFIADTLWIHFPVDSTPSTTLQIKDFRQLPPNILAIKEVKKWKYIPVDQYVALNQPLTGLLQYYLHKDTVRFDGTLIIDHLNYWNDKAPFFAKGEKLNGYSRLLDSSGNVIRAWQWEFRFKPKKKQTPAERYVQMTETWIQAQETALRQNLLPDRLSPYRYRRQLVSWLDYIILPDGYILNAHLTLDYPSDQQAAFVRGSPGIYYRKSAIHESIAIGGMDQQWYYRLNDRFVARLNATLRFGLNNFNSGKFDHVDFQNILLINLGFSAALEYRPVYYRGVIFGLGLHQSLNIMPEIVQLYEAGLLFTIGVILP